MKKRTNAFVIVSLILVIILTIYFSVLIWKYPLVGIGVKEENGQHIISGIYDNSWAKGKPVALGDLVTHIDGQDPKLHVTVELFNRIEKAKSVTIIKGNSSPTTLSISYGNLNYQYGIPLIIPFVFTISTILISLYLFNKTKEDHAAIVLIYFLLSLGICYLSALGSARGDVVGRIVTTLTLPGSLILFVHFLSNYFSKLNLVYLKKRTLKLIYLVFFLFLPVMFAYHYNKKEIETLFLSIFILILGFILLSFGQFYLKNKHSEGKSNLKILLLTLFVALTPFVGFYAIPSIVFGKELMAAEISATFLITIPIAFVYLQLAERLFDINFFINRFRYYSLLTLPLALGITFGLSLLSNSLLMSSYNVANFLLIYISLILFLYIKEYIDYKNRRNLFSQKNNYEASLYQFFQKTKYETKVNSLIAHIMTEIKDVLSVNEVHSIEVQVTANQKQWNIKNNKSYSEYIVCEIETIDWENTHLGSLVEFSNGFCVVIGEDINTRNIIFGGLKLFRPKLNLQEKIWLETISYFFGVLLENFILIEGLFQKIENYKEKIQVNNTGYPIWLSRLLFSISEKERASLSIDLHDSVLQDQLQLLRDVESIKGKIKDPSIICDLTILMERMLDNIHLIRETCNELRPPFLRELGIIQSILNLIEQTKLRSNFILYSELDPAIPKLEQDYELTIYRVVQELLNNAMKHSFASTVRIALKKGEESLILFYQDNGVGMDMTKLQDSIHTMGIAGIKERINSLGGRVWFKSSPREGLTVTIELNMEGNKHD